MRLDNYSGAIKYLFILERTRSSYELQIYKKRDSYNTLHIKFSMKDKVVFKSHAGISPLRHPAGMNIHGAFRTDATVEGYINTVRKDWFKRFNNIYNLYESESTRELLDVYATLIVEYILKNARIYGKVEKVIHD